MFKKSPHTVDDVMNVFRKTMTDLNKVAEDQELVVEDLNAEKEVLETALKEAEEESARARRVAASLGEILYA